MFFIEKSEYYFLKITRKNRRKLLLTFKQRFGRNSDLFKRVLELFKLQLRSLSESDKDFGKRFPKWFVDIILHQLGYILQRNPDDVLDLKPKRHRGSNPDDVLGSNPDDVRGSNPDDVLGSNPDDVLVSNPERHRGPTCHCSHLSAERRFLGALDAGVNHAVKGLLQKLIEHPDKFGWILDRHANEAVEIANNDFKANSMLQASSALSSSDLPSDAASSAAASDASASAAAASADLPAEIYD